MCGRSNTLSVASIAAIQAINQRISDRAEAAAASENEARNLGGAEREPELFAASKVATDASLTLARTIDNILLAEVSADTAAGRRYVEASTAFTEADAAFNAVMDSKRDEAFQQLFAGLDAFAETSVQ